MSGARILLALLAGGATVAAFEPFGLYLLALPGLAALAALLRGVGSARSGFALGFAWGFGFFISGVSWLYVALNRFGGMPMPLAAAAIALFCAYLALYPGLAAALFARLRRRRSRTGAVAAAALFAALWLLTEWLRGVALTGFPWLASGYSQTPPSPLAGFLPLLGVYGVGGLLAFLAGLLAFADWQRPRALLLPAVVAAVLLGGGASLGGRTWTEPDGEPLRVALVQPAFDQSLKWDPAQFAMVLRANAELVRQAFADASTPQLVVLPETTLPALFDQLPEGYADALAGIARDAGGDLVLGVFLRDAGGHIYNAAISLGRTAPQSYAKHHLVPFGEYSPPLFDWFYRLVAIPMSDQTRGAADQPPMVFGERRIALNICYEDLFGAEIIRALPQAGMLLNLSNLAWYGDSFAQPQHLQIARVRALESGRPMLRSTNTGMTAVIQPDGEVTAVLAEFERGVLYASVQAFRGDTPYARWGDRAALALALIVLVLFAGRWARRGEPR